MTVYNVDSLSDKDVANKGEECTNRWKCAMIVEWLIRKIVNFQS